MYNVIMHDMSHDEDIAAGQAPCIGHRNPIETWYYTQVLVENYSISAAQNTSAFSAYPQ